MKTELSDIRENIINRVTVLSAVFLSLPYFLGIVRMFNTGWLNIYYLHTFLYLTMVIASIFRKKIALNLKITLNSAVFLIVAFAGLYSFSIGGAYFYAIIAIAVLTLLVERKTTLIMTSVIAFFFFIIAYGHISGRIIPKADLDTLSTLPSQWLTLLTSIFFLIAIFIFAFGDIYRKLTSSLSAKEANEKKYMMLFEKANDAITLLKDGVFFDCNEKACEFFMYSKSELIGKQILELSPEFQYDGQLSESKTKQLLTLCINGEAQLFEWQHTKSNGELFDCSISLNRVELNDDVYIQAILRDITEQKRKDIELKKHKEHLEELVKEKTEELECTNEELRAINEEVFEKNNELQVTLTHLHETQSQLLQSEKMASLGTLTAGVAHEINNPLNYIMGAYVGLDNYFKEYGSMNNQKTDIFLKSINAGIERASGIVKGLNQFSRNSETLDEICDMHSILDNSLLMLHNKMKHTVTVEKKYTESNFSVKGNVGMLHQVFINVLSNAIYAIAENGKITLSTAIKKKNVEIVISDTGCGIEEDKLTQITDPFYTTKPPGEGTGLGLSITYSIIKEHKGTISFDSEIGKGTKVTIKLPIDN